MAPKHLVVELIRNEQAGPQQKAKRRCLIGLVARQLLPRMALLMSAWNCLP